MMGHKICFYGDIWPIIPILSVLLLRIWSTGWDFADSAEIIVLISQWVTTYIRALDRRKYLMVIFLISYQNHML